MKHVAFAVAALLLAWPAPRGFSAAPQKPAVEVRGFGCVEAGVEANCLVVKDLKGGSLFNLLVKGARPDIGDGIEFVGVPHQGPTMCMQGIAIDVTNWSRKDTIKCKPAHAKRK